MTAMESSVVDVNQFAGKLWVLIEELHCWQKSLRKYEKFDQKLWELCLEYPQIDHPSLLMVESLLQCQYGHMVRMLTAQYAFNELRKIVSPELYQTIRIDPEKTPQKNCDKTQSKTNSVYWSKQWLSAHFGNRKKLTEISTITVNVIRLITYVLIGLYYLRHPEKIMLHLLPSDDKLVELNVF